MEDRKKKILVGSVIGVVIIGLVVIVLLWESSSSSPSDLKCQLRETEPTPVDPNKLKNIADAADYKSLATLDAHLVYHRHEEDTVFQSLNLLSIKYTPGNGSSSLELSTDCASIQLELGDPEISGIRVVAGGEESRCKLDTPIEWAMGEHYVCSIKTRYICFVKSGNVMELVTNKLEFEVNGNPILIKDGKYSTLEESCKPPGLNPKDP